MSNQILISSGAKLRDLDDVIIGTDGILSSLGFDVPYGVPRLDANGKILASELPNSVMEFKGVWNAATNTPTLTNGVGNAGDVYLCNVAGTVDFGAGPITFAVGDYAVYTGSVWARSSGAVGTVTSVAVSRSGDALTITGSPITTSGTINIGFTGNSSQYINGAGNLVTFPTIISEAQNLVTEVYNETGATLTKGTVVYINGGHGNLPTVTKAIATSDATSAQTYGVVRADITNNNNGYVTVIGSLNDLDTQAYPAGTQLYLSGTTAGAWTSTKPSAPIHLVYVGIVVRSHPTQGVVEIRIQNGYELEELHDVQIIDVANNDGIFYDSATSLWKNKTIAEVLGYTPANAATTLTINGTTYDLSANRTWNVGTVTSVGLSAPTGFSVTGSPVTSSGTLALSFAAGYSLPTNVKQSNWDDAYTWVAAFPTQTGNAGKFLTTDGSTLSWAANPLGTVTSVAMSVPTGLSVAGSPITTSGTLAVTFAAGYSIPTNASQANWDTAYTNRITSLTTTGSSGSATLISNTLNIPTYTLAGLGGQPQLNGTGFVKITGTTISYDNSTYLSTGSASATYVPYSGAVGSVNLGTYSLTATGITVSKSSGISTITFPQGTNDPAFIQHEESTIDVGIMRFSVSDNDLGTDYFVFGNSPSGVFNERFKILATGIVSLGTWQGTAIADAYIASAATWNAKQNAITLTTTGSSGAATLVGATLNIPNYGSALSGYLPLGGGTLTGNLNGTTINLSGNLYTPNIGVGVSSIVSSSNASILQIGTNGIIENVVGSQMMISNNAYYTGSSWNYINTAPAQALRFGAQLAGDVSFHIAPSGTAGTSITNWDASNIKFYISPTGNIGMGTATPTDFGSSFTTLDVYNGGTGGYILARSSTTTLQLGTGNNIAYVGTRSANDLVFTSNNANKMRLTSGGYFGINTDSPDAIFTVNKTNGNYTSASAAHMLITNTDAYGQSSIYYTFSGVMKSKLRTDYVGNLNYVTNGGDHTFWVGGDAGTGSVKMYITNAGPIWINTSTGVSGGGALQVNGDVNINGNFKINGTIIGGGGGSGVTGSGTSGYAAKWTSASTLGNSIFYDNGTEGWVRSNIFRLYDTTEKATLYYSSAANGVELNTGSTSGAFLQFVANGNINLRLHSSGNTSVGTTSDNGYKLNVNGSLYVSGSAVYAGGVTYSSTQTFNGLTYFNSTMHVKVNETLSFDGTSAITMGNTGSELYVVGNILLNGAISQYNGFAHTFQGTATAYNVLLLNSGNSIDEITILGGVRLSTTTAGLIPPRMTTTQLNALSTRGATFCPNGTTVFDTTINILRTWNGSAWMNLW